MSNRPCNRCHLERITQDAASQALEVTVVPTPSKYFPHGVDVYVHSPDDPPNTTHIDGKAGNCRWVAWFAEVPDHCAC